MDTGKKQDLRRGRSGPPSAHSPVVPLASPHSLPRHNANPLPDLPLFFCIPIGFKTYPIFLHPNRIQYPSQFNLVRVIFPSQRIRVTLPPPPIEAQACGRCEYCSNSMCFAVILVHVCVCVCARVCVQYARPG